MTLTIAPPELQSSTASSALVVVPDDDAEQFAMEALVEEKMGYAPIARGRLVGPEYPAEVEPDDDGYGPMGY